MKKLLLLLTLLMIIEIFCYFLRDIMISVSLSLAVRRSDSLSLERLVRAAEERRNGSGEGRTGCGWTKMTILEDEDDRLRHRHNERHLGSDSKYYRL